MKRERKYELCFIPVNVRAGDVLDLIIIRKNKIHD